MLNHELEPHERVLGCTRVCAVELVPEAVGHGRQQTACRLADSIQLHGLHAHLNQIRLKLEEGLCAHAGHQASQRSIFAFAVAPCSIVRPKV